MSGIQFGPNGCKFKVGGGPCREKETLQIIQQFKQLYEAKLREIETEDGGGDNLEAKVCLQRDWIRDLTEQNEMLVRAVEELEREATDRVTMLEEKLKNTARSGSEAAIEVKEKDGRLKELEDQLKQMTAQMQAKETELAKVTQRGSIADEDNTNLLARLKKAEEENKTLKDSIMGANQELDKLYAQANGYVVERDDFKKKYNDSIGTIETLTKEGAAAKDAFAKANNKNAEALKNMKDSNKQNLAELERVRRDSEAMSQAQNATIDALQQALTEKAQRQRQVDESASAASWETTSTTKGGVSENIDASVQGLSGTGLSAGTVSRSAGRSGGVDKSLGGMESDSTAGGMVSRGAGRPGGIDSGTSALADGGMESVSTAAGMGSQAEGGTGGVDPSEILQALRRGSVGELSRMLKKLAEERDIERAKHNQEVANLKATIDEVEKSIGGGQLEISGLQTQECICELENELIQRRVENSHLKQHLCALTCELTAMQRVLDEAKQLHNSFIELQEAHADQVQQNDQIRQELIRLTKIKEIDTVRIRELQEMVVGKSEESDAYEQELFCCKQKLDMALSHNDELKGEISELLANIQSYEQNCVMNEERTDYCQQEIETCKGNLTELKDKLLLMNDLLHKKVEQYNELETNYCMQGNSLACLQKEIAENQLHHEEDQHDLKVAIKDLNEKLIEADNNYRELHEDFKRSQAQVIDLTRKEAQLQQECARCKQECTLKLKQAENDALCMTECINKLKMDKSSDSLQKRVAEEELESLKTDFIKIEQEFNQIKETNEDLKDQLYDMQTSMQTCKERYQATNDQYNKCVAEMKIQQCEKQCLDSENKQYKKQLAMLQRAHAELNRSYDQLLKTMNALKCKCAGQQAMNGKSQKTVKRNPRICDSGCISGKDCGSADDYYQYTSDNDEFMDEDERCYCVQRVETLSQLLQQSDKYWKSKMDDNDYVVTRDQ